MGAKKVAVGQADAAERGQALVEDGVLVELLPELASEPMPVSHPHGRKVPKRVRAVIGWLASVIRPRLS